MLTFLSRLPNGLWIRVDTNKEVELPNDAVPMGPYFLVDGDYLRELIEALNEGFRIVDLPLIDIVHYRSIPEGFVVELEKFLRFLLSVTAEGFFVERAEEIEPLEFRALSDGFITEAEAFSGLSVETNPTSEGTRFYDT